jgi:phage tail P2-like protein
MIKLADALVTDGLPAFIGAKAWVTAFAQAERDMRRRELEYTAGTGVYDNLEDVSDAVLDVLACDLNIAWYNPDYTAATKRQIIRDAILIKRKMGTKYAVRKAVCDLHPNSEIEEWFEYSGTPSHFRVVCTVDNSTEPPSITALRENVTLYKRLTARLDGIVLQTLFGLAVGIDTKVWLFPVGMTGEYSAGTWPITSTFAGIGANALTAAPVAAAFAFTSDMAGTVPNTATHGRLPIDGPGINATATVNTFAATAAGTEICTGAAGGGLNAAGIAPGDAVQNFCFDTPYCGDENL